MNTKMKLCALAVPLALAGCGEQSGAEKAARAAMKDPDSAKFGEFYFNSKTGKACLTTNGKNSMGGYTGNQEMRLFKDKDGWQVEDDKEELHATCIVAYADSSV